MVDVEQNDEFDVNVIGKGYRNVVYRVNPETHTGEIVLFGYDINGKPKNFKFPHKSHIKYKVPYKTGELSIFGDDVATKWFKNIYERNKWLQSVDGNIHVFESNRPEQEFLKTRFHKYANDDDFNKQDTRKHFIDIEIAVENEFPDSKTAGYPINLITVFDSKYERYHTFALPNAGTTVKNTLNKKMDLILHEFESEHDLLTAYIEWTELNRPDMYVGWNIRSFDMPYIVRRLENLFDKDMASRISPVHNYWVREDRNNPREITVNIDGISQCDQLLLYRDKYLVKIDGGYKLDNVCETELGENKIHYKGSIKDFYKRDFQSYFEYNVRDVELLMQLEDKLQHIPLSRQVTSSGLCPFESIYTSMSYIIGSLSIHAMNGEMGTFPSYTNGDAVAQSFEGAYVFPTKLGLYTDGVIGVDLKSLYPNTMIALNCSPETKVGQLYPIDGDTWTLHRTNGKTIKITQEQLDKLLDTRCILSCNNTLTYKHAVKEGVVTQWLERSYNERVKYKKLQRKFDNKSDKETDSVLKLEYQNQSKIYDNMQYTYKIFMNSIYGILGLPFSPIYDVDLAQSVTLTGQSINKGVSDLIRSKFGDDCIVAGDTDSQYVNIETLTHIYCKKFGKDTLQEFTRTETNEMLKEIDTFVEVDINTFSMNHMNDMCHTTKGHHIQYEREVLASESIFFKKKHYLMHLIDVDGKSVDKFKYMGIAVKKGELPQSIKTFLKDIYENTCINKWGYDEYVNYLNDVYEKFTEFNFEDISEWKGYGTEKESTGFLQTQKGSLAVVRGIHYHNDLLSEFKILDKYNEIRVGAKVRCCYINPTNPYGIDVISYMDGELPEEFMEMFTIDYTKMFNKLVIRPLVGYVEAMNFMSYTPSNQMVEDVFSL